MRVKVEVFLVFSKGYVEQKIPWNPAKLPANESTHFSQGPSSVVTDWDLELRTALHLEGEFWHLDKVRFGRCSARKPRKPPTTNNNNNNNNNKTKRPFPWKRLSNSEKPKTKRQNSLKRRHVFHLFLCWIPWFIIVFSKCTYFLSLLCNSTPWTKNEWWWW